MAHDAKPRMKYTIKDLESNLIIRYAAFMQDPVEIVHYHRHYSLNHTEERGIEWVQFGWSVQR
jgi:hypothetical protein